MIIFRDRAEAGEKLVEAIKKDKELISKIDNAAVVSLLRGGIVIGNVLAEKLGIPHYPLVVAKIPAPFPHSPELAIGALCVDFVYRDERVLASIHTSRGDIEKQIEKAKGKQESYRKRFKLEWLDFNEIIKDKIIFLVDDGIATGSTVRAAALFIKSKKPKKIVLAVPVAPTEFDTSGFDKVFILHLDPYFTAVSQFYHNFPEVKDEEVEEILSHENTKTRKQTSTEAVE